MDTKWKNIKLKAKGFLEKCWMSSTGIAVKLFCLVLVGFGAAFWYSIVAYRTYHPTGESLFFGILGNVLFGAGQTILTAFLVVRKFREWNPGEKDTYVKWQNRWKSWMRKLQWIGGTALIVALWYMSYLMNGGMYMGGGWSYNYASGYVMILSVIVQFMISETVMNHFKKKQLDMIMCNLDEINQNRIKEALEIERKSLEKVSRSDQLRVDLITNVSHDLKTPLTSMVGYIELIKREELSDVVRDYVDVISERAGKLKEMINSLFNLAKASSGNVELHLEPFEVNRMIEQIFADMDDRIRESHLEFVTDLTKEDTSLISDNSYFYRICQNLIENALKYSAKGTRVFVKTKLLQLEGKEEVCLEVTNTSEYPMDFTKEDIIERFARGDKARSGDGNGLGLAIVSTYAKALGGEFDILIDCDQFKACLKFPKTIS